MKRSNQIHTRTVFGEKRRRELFIFANLSKNLILNIVEIFTFTATGNVS
jgi:hypothetical protein